MDSILTAALEWSKTESATHVWQFLIFFAGMFGFCIAIGGIVDNAKKNIEPSLGDCVGQPMLGFVIGAVVGTVSPFGLMIGVVLAPFIIMGLMIKAFVKHYAGPVVAENFKPEPDEDDD
jgi:Na+-driven multidrug efflux pump